MTMMLMADHALDDVDDGDHVVDGGFRDDEHANAAISVADRGNLAGGGGACRRFPDATGDASEGG